ncbi:unnamed protein product [Lasius platythorax]|uniref:Uncharacterized protein n=1 Tax=Lasius platythorax TaxID=488582 RepID=A0AAV2NGF6_9HYME
MSINNNNGMNVAQMVEKDCMHN